jgi:hypothetical protein
MTIRTDGEFICKGDPVVEAAARIYQARLMVAAVTFGLSRVRTAAETPQLAAELNTLWQMASQAGDALEALQRNLVLVAAEGNG